MGGWLLRIGKHNPPGLLKLLLRAQEIEDNEASMAMAFRAGVRVGLKHPDLGRQVLGEPEWMI